MPCSCLCCSSCIRSSISDQLQRTRKAQRGRAAAVVQQPPSSQQAELAKGTAVLYLDRNGVFVESVVQQIDR